MTSRLRSTVGPSHQRSLQRSATQMRPTAQHASSAALPNHLVSHRLTAERVQPKLTINQPGDAFEREADAAAERVMRMSDRDLESGSTPAGASPPSVQRLCAECEHEELERGGAPPIQRRCAACEEEEVQRKPASVGIHEAAPPGFHADLAAIRSSGQPLPGSVRAFFEPRFGRTFENVRVHADDRAAASARSIHAHAYTSGTHIVFDRGRYAPDTTAGRTLLAHELAHTIQQTANGASRPPIQRTIGDGHDLQAPRLRGNLALEGAFDNELVIRQGRRGTAVRLLQESLLAQGYTFPGFGADGIFGPETEAVVRQFQTDVGARVDGIVGPETMQHMDRRDPSNLAGIGPVAKVGPLPGPRPAPAAGCDQPFQGVTFTLANQVGAGVTPAAAIGIARVNGRDGLQMRGIAPATYQPRVTINAPSAARAREFEAGLIQNLLSETVTYRYTTGIVLRSTLPTPIKDGAPVRSGFYHAIFAENGTRRPGILANFTGNGATVQLNLPDRPGEFAFVDVLDNPECFGPLAPATLTSGLFRDNFRTWVGVRHRPSGCVRTIHHIDWGIDWSATVNGTVTPPAVTVTSNVLNVTQTNGNGSPAFIQGGRVPDDLLAANRICGP